MGVHQFDLGIRCDHFLSMAGGKAEPRRDVFVGIRNGRIAEISAHAPARQSQCAKWIDARNQVVLPGFVNGHAHLAMTLFRGLEDDLPLQKWLFERIIPLEGELVDPDFVRVGTELAMLESIRFGVTSVCEMYFFPNTVAEVVEKAGLRARIGQVFGAVPFPEDRVVGTDKEALFKKFRERWAGHERIIPDLAPHAVYTASDDILKTVARLSDQYSAGIHIHLSETRFEVEDWVKKRGKTPVRYLNELGLLRKGTLCAHCVHLDSDDIGILRESGASVAYNPDSNLKLTSGIAPVTEYLRRGIPVAFGTDGSASNNDLSIFGAMDLGTKLQKQAAGDSTAMTAEQALWWATGGGAQALGLADTGTLEVGKKADLVAVDLDFPHLRPLHNVVSQLVYAAQGLEVDTVVCEGRVLLQNKVHQTLDMDRILSEVAPIHEKITKAVERLKK